MRHTTSNESAVHRTLDTSLTHATLMSQISSKLHCRICARFNAPTTSNPGWLMPVLVTLNNIFAGSDCPTTAIARFHSFEKTNFRLFFSPKSLISGSKRSLPLVSRFLFMSPFYAPRSYSLALFITYCTLFWVRMYLPRGACEHLHHGQSF